MERTVQVTMRMDANLRDECKKFFSACGLSISQGIQMALREMLQEGKITVKPSYSKETLEAMAEADDILAHPNKYKSFANAEEMFDDIMKVAEDSK